MPKNFALLPCIDKGFPLSYLLFHHFIVEQESLALSNALSPSYDSADKNISGVRGLELDRSLI